MAGRCVLKSFLLLVNVFSCGVQAGKQSVPEGYRQVAHAHAIPAEMLYSLALTESASALPHGTRPWPWTLNVVGKGYRYATRLAAWQALQIFMQSYPLKRIDIGIAQVNLGWNGHRFRSVWDMLDPYLNLDAAAQILRECWDRNPGSWLTAAGCYHHPAGGRFAARYTATLKRQLAQINITPPDASLNHGDVER